MKMISKGILLSALGLVIGHQASAASPSQIDTITCTRADGSTLKHNVYAFTLDANGGNPRYFSVYFLDTVLETYLDEMYFGSGFSNCIFGKLPGTLMDTVTVIDVNTAGVGANVGAVSIQENSVSQAYTEVTFQYTFLFIGPNKVSPTIPLGSQEEQAKALAAFKSKGLALPK